MAKKFELIIIILSLLASVLLWVYYIYILIFHYDMDIKTLVSDFFETMELKKNECILLFIIFMFIIFIYIYFFKLFKKFKKYFRKYK